MSRRKQAKPQHINSEEDQGEQQPQQPTPEFADAAPAAPAAGELGEWGWGARLGRGASRTYAGSSRARASGSGPRPAQIQEPRFGGSVPGRRGRLLSPPPRLLHVSHFFLFPSCVSSPPAFSPYCKIDPHSLLRSPRSRKVPFSLSSAPHLTGPTPLTGVPPSLASLSKERTPGDPHPLHQPVGAFLGGWRRGAPLEDPPEEDDLLHAPLPGQVGGGGATSPTLRSWGAGHPRCAGDWRERRGGGGGLNVSL